MNMNSISRLVGGCSELMKAQCNSRRGVASAKLITVLIKAKYLICYVLSCTKKYKVSWYLQSIFITPLDNRCKCVSYHTYILYQNIKYQISNTLFGRCLLCFSFLVFFCLFCLFLFLSFCLLSFCLDITLIKCLKGSEVSKVTLCVKILKWRSLSD